MQKIKTLIEKIKTWKDINYTYKHLTFGKWYENERR